jgi:hypothetical protein
VDDIGVDKPNTEEIAAMDLFAAMALNTYISECTEYRLEKKSFVNDHNAYLAKRKIPPKLVKKQVLLDRSGWLLSCGISRQTPEPTAGPRICLRGAKT